MIHTDSLREVKEIRGLQEGLTCQYGGRQVVQVQARLVELEDVFKCFHRFIDVSSQLAWRHTSY